MYCCKCQNELSRCTCPDMKERLERISKIDHLYIAPEYMEKLKARAKTNENQESLPE